MAPNMDYDEWTPLGHGDPLKNDPTFDYSPPMVGKVKYWINPMFRTPDPPIVPNRGNTELTTETSKPYTATTVATSNSISPSPLPSLPTTSKLSPSDIKRFYIDFKDHTATDVTYMQILNSKYNNKVVRPQTVVAAHQNHYYVPTRQPPAPLPMLVPPPPVEPSSYSSTKTENSTALELSWDIPHKGHVATSTAPASVTINAGVYFTSSSPSAPVEPLLHLTTSPPLPPTTVARMPAMHIKHENKPDAFRLPTTATILSTSDRSILKNLLGKERLEANHRVTGVATTTMLPLTPNPATPYSSKQSPRPTKLPTYLIIQGHSKVKKYGGGASKLDRVDVPALQDTNEINDVKYELPRESRGGRQLNVEDFLPFDGLLKDFISNQAEGSGIGAELTKAVFPSYVRPSTTLQYDQPRGYEYDSDDEVYEA